MGTISLGFIPAASRLGLHHQRHLQLGHLLHFPLQNGGGCLGLRLGALDDQLVVDLENELGLQPGLPKGLIHPDHGQLDDIRRRALDGGVQRHPLAEGAEVEVAALELRQIPPPAIERGHIALGLGGLDDVLHIGADAAVVGEIGVHIGPGLVGADADILGQGPGRDAVDNAEVDGLGVAAHLRRHLVQGDPEDLGGRDRVNVLTGGEGRLHMGVAGDMGQHPQLNLTVVGVHQNPAGPGYEHLANLAAQLPADRDVLEIGLRGTETARGRDHVLEGGVNAAVVGDDLEQAVGIGGGELGQHPVFENGVDDRVLGPQLLQHLGVGVIAGLGLLHRGQAQLVEENRAQLFGGENGDFLPGQGIDRGLGLVNAPGQHGSEVRQRGPVHGHADALHVREHGAEGELDLPVEPVHALGLQLVRQHRPELGHGRGLGGQIGGGAAQIGRSQLRDGIVRLRRVQQIACQRYVEVKAPGRPAPVQQPAPDRLPVGAGLAAAALAEGLDGTGGGRADARLPGHGHGLAVGGEGQGAGGVRRRQRTGQGRGLGLGLGRRRGGPETVAVDEPYKFKLREEREEGGLVGLLPQGVLGRKVDGGLAADRGQIVGEPGALLSGPELFPHGLPDVGGVEMLVDPVQGAEFQEQVRGGLGSHARHAGDVVGAVAHETLEVDEPPGLKAVLGFKYRGRVEGGQGLTALGGDQLDADAVVDQLEAVPVAGDHDALPVPAAADFGHRADDVVGLPALTGVDGDAHGGEHFLHHRHLLGQLLGHAVAGGLVALVLQVAEGGALEVEGHAEGVRLIFLHELFQNVQKAIDGVGIESLPGGEGPDAVERPVDDAVAVENHQFHGDGSLWERCGAQPCDDAIKCIIPRFARRRKEYRTQKTGASQGLPRFGAGNVTRTHDLLITNHFAPS